MYASAGFVEDSIVFSATFVPFIFLFEFSPIILASALHLLSIPCVALAHTARIDGLEAYVLILTISVTTLVDLGVGLFCACQFRRSDLCCEALGWVGVNCLERFSDVPVAVFLLPASVYNCFRGIIRFADVGLSASNSGRKGATSALLTAVQA